MRQEYIPPAEQLQVKQPFRRCQKFFLKAKKFGPKQARSNTTTEALYHQVISQVKKLYAKLPIEKDRTVFEMDRKSDKTSVTGMHDFITSSFYWCLECDVWGKYWINYAFHNCLFKPQIQEMIDSCCLYSSSRVKEIQNFNEFYKTVLSCQPKEFISVLSFDEA